METKGLPRIYLSEPTPRLQQLAAGTWQDSGIEVLGPLTIVDSSRHLHDEAALLDAAELTEAKAALIEDEVFSAPSESQTKLRAAIKYGWSLLHLSQVVADQPVLWSVARGSVPTTPAELSFLAQELTTRGLRVAAIMPCWPVALEAEAELGERAEGFSTVLREYAATAGDLFIRHAGSKTAALGEIARILGGRAVLDWSRSATMAAARVLARRDGGLFRELLIEAQQHFPLDKDGFELSTTEDDVHTLPDVADDELERIFLDDLRGRQLLHATAGSTFTSPQLVERLEAAVAAEENAIREILASQVRESLALIRPCAVT